MMNIIKNLQSKFFMVIEDNYYGDGLNLYAYCRNNPLAYVDPSGHGTESASDKENQSWDEDYEKFYEDMYDNQRDGNEQYENYVEDLRNLEGTDPSDATMAKEFENEYGIDGDKQGTNDGQDSSKSGTDSIGNIGNPSNNPKVLADAMEDYTAVYGYRPYGYRTREDGSIKQFANYAWSDPKVVAELREIRLDYLQENRAYQNMVDNMRNAGCSDTEIAQRLVAERNAHRLSYYVDETGKIINEDLYR